MAEKLTLKQLSERLDGFDAKLTGLGDLAAVPQRLTDAQAAIDRSNDASTKATASQQQAQSLLDTAGKWDATLQTAADTLQTLTESAKESDRLLLAKLGVANAEVLANSFGGQAAVLDGTIRGWWKRLRIWIISLTLMIIAVIVFENYNGQHFNSIGFFLKFVVASPIAYMAYYAGKQHRLETNLWHQYNFKAAVARSLEAYRKLLADNLVEGDVEGAKKLNEFLQNQIAAIFREPLETLLRIDEDEAHDSLIIGAQGRVLGLLKRLTGLSERLKQ